MEITGKILKKGNIDVKAVCIEFCTNEERYLDPDSHFVHIPRDLYVDFLSKKAKSGFDSSPLYVGIRNSKNPSGKKFFFGRVEPSLTTANSHHTMVLLPRWVFEKLEMDLMDGTVDIVYTRIPQPVALMKLKGSNSSYTKTDIKTALENRLSGFNCLNKDEEFRVGETSFKVVELRNKENNVIEFGSIYNIDDCNLDFELCDDEIEKEKQRVEALKQADFLRNKPRELQKANSEIHETQSKNMANKFGQLNKKYSTFGARVHSLKGDNEEKKEEYSFKDVGHKIGGDTKAFSNMFKKDELSNLPNVEENKFQDVGHKIGGEKVPLTRQQIAEARMKAFEAQKG